MMDRRNYKAELDAMLAKYGGFYTFDDILQHIDDGRMQSFAAGQSWMATQVNEFPQKKVLQVVFVVGDINDFANLEAQLLAFKDQIGADMIMAAARPGFLKVKSSPEWRATNVNFVRV